jgi:polysaccharide pyruvyl transferase WcaK-like protein
VSDRSLKSITGSVTSDGSDQLKNVAERKVLVINVCNPFSLGGAAIASTLVRQLKAIPDVSIDMMLTRQRDAQVYSKEYGMNNVTFLRHVWYREREKRNATIQGSIIPLIQTSITCFLSHSMRKIGISAKDPFSKYNAILDLNSDALNEHYGYAYPIFTLINIALASFSDKPLIICPCSVAIFRNPIIRYIAHIVLNRASIILIREETSGRNLKELGITKPKIVLIPDLAFLFKSHTSKLPEELAAIVSQARNEAIIGIVPSNIISKFAFLGKGLDRMAKQEEYVRLMAEVTDFVIDRFGARVILIPHSFGGQGALSSFSDVDDRIMCRQIRDSSKNRQNVACVVGQYSANEMKELIGRCDMLIGCRMHSAIASVTQLVPTIALAYGQKFDGVIGGIIGQSDQIVRIEGDYKTVLSQTESSILSTWANRSSLKKELQIKVAKIQKRARAFVMLVSNVIQSEKTS